MGRERFIVCRSRDGRDFKAHFYGHGAERGSRLICKRCGDSIQDHKNRRNAKWMRERIKRLAKQGRCVCGKPQATGLNRCQRCHDAAMERQRRQRERAKQDRVCYVCGLRTHTGHSMCDQCRSDRRATNRRLVREGICIQCRQPNDQPGRNCCRRCASMRAATNRRLYHAGRIRVRATPRGKQKPWTPRHGPIKTPIAAKVYVPPAGSIALQLLANEPARRSR